MNLTPTDLSFGTPGRMTTLAFLLLSVITDILPYAIGPSFALAQSTSCGTIGNGNEIELDERLSRKFFLNPVNPAPCTGYVTSWRVCYYGPDDEVEDVSYWATYAVYRRVITSTGSQRYERMSETFRAVRTYGGLTDVDSNGIAVDDGEIEYDEFSCYTDAVEGTLLVQAGDVVGACVFNPEDSDTFIRRQLNVVGESEVNGEYLLEMGERECSNDETPLIIPSNDLKMRNSRRLHIYANIVATDPTPITTTDPVQSEISATTSSDVEVTDSSSATLTNMNPTEMSTFFPDVTTINLETTENVKPETSTFSQTIHGPQTTRSNTETVTSSYSQTPTTPATIGESEDETPSSDDKVSIMDFEVFTISSSTLNGSNGLTSASEATVKIAAGASIGVLLLLLLLAVAIVVTVLYVVKRTKKADENYSDVRAAGRFNEHGWDNVIYEMNETEIDCGSLHFIMEPRAYEIPVSTMHMGRSTEYETEVTGSIYTVPIVYEYATLGPNEETDVGSEHYYSLEETSISYSKLLEKNKEEDIYGSLDWFHQPAMIENELYSQLKSYGIRNIPADHIQINGHLGSGHFGSVEQGLWRDGNKIVHVALKLLKDGACEKAKMKLLQEAAIMAQFKHPNVLALYGVVSKDKPLMLVVQLIHKGDLRKHLHTIRPDPGELPGDSLPKLLLSFSQHVALGMHYLSSKGFVHRDLAARNILVSKDNICKVADFGMSRNLADGSYYVSQGGEVPVKWTAPEAIYYKKYSTASDVWSYGCLLYEIWSLGHKPFKGVENSKVTEIVDSGKRLSPTPGCPRAIYELMIMCWNPNAHHRPSFRDLLLLLLENPEEVLSIPPGALDTHHLAGVFCSPLKIGENMYCDLQERYKH